MAQRPGQARADVDPILEKQLKALQQQAADEATARAKGEPSPWMMPDANGWNGDLFAVQDIEKSFDRAQSNEWFTEATKDADQPGVVGDLIVATTQIDWLAVLERAFRARHLLRRPRALALALGRKAGHGHNKGALVQAVLEHVRGLVKQSKGES